MQRRTAKRDSLAGKPSAVEAGLQRDRTAEWDCRGDLPTCTCMGQYVTHQRDIKHRVLCHSAAGVQGGGESEEVGALTCNRRRHVEVVDVARPPGENYNYVVSRSSPESCMANTLSSNGQ